jgi:hypothetical protein
MELIGFSEPPGKEVKKSIPKRKRGHRTSEPRA